MMAEGYGPNRIEIESTMNKTNLKNIDNLESKRLL